MLKQIIFLVVSMYLKITKIMLCHTENIFLAGAFNIARSTAINSIKIILKCLHDTTTYIYPSYFLFTDFIFKIAIS